MTTEEKEFKNEDFHIRVWETEDEIGGETIFVKEGFRREGKVSIQEGIQTMFFPIYLPDFGMSKTTDRIRKSMIENYTFQDIVDDLETAHNESLEAHSKEVTIEDVIKELEDVDTVEERLKILNKYEIKHTSNSSWISLDNLPNLIDNTLCFKLGIYKLRKKGNKQ